ncbi:MAG: ROK family transcriptional regulator [Caldisericia bacterium]|nr:ROK family transcriptional regulator [Caldisericia bacterium]
MERSLKFIKTASAKLQFKINTSIIFNYIRENEPIPRIKISNDLKISPSAVSRVIDKLIKEEYVVEADKLKTKGGKRPTLIKIKQNKDFVIGIDLGKEKFKIALADFNGEIIKKYRGFKISNDRNIAEKIINEINTILSKYCENEKIRKNNLKAVSIGVPADIDMDSGKVISAPLYGNWKDLNLKEILGNEFKIPVYIENDANLSALGEKYYGKGKNFKDFIFVEISNGIGAGIIIDNHLFRGSFGSAGEIGFTMVSTENLNFKVKNKGFLGKSASVGSIKKKAIREISDGRKTIITEIVKNDIEKIEPCIVCKAAADGDELANDIITEMVNLLSIGIINLILIQNPQIIVLGGDICNLPEVDKLFLEPIKEKISNSIPFRIPEIELSLLSEDAGIIGASFKAIESLLMDKFPYKIEKETTS